MAVSSFGSKSGPGDDRSDLEDVKPPSVPLPHYWVPGSPETLLGTQPHSPTTLMF